ncbi:MAG: hypothetical protein ACKO1K_00680 [Burkholderiales bacterium]
MNQNHEFPISELNTAGLPWAVFRFARVSVAGFQLITRLGAGGGDNGTIAAAMRPTIAK